MNLMITESHHSYLLEIRLIILGSNLGLKLPLKQK